jgi:hypothetical protein
MHQPGPNGMPRAAPGSPPSPSPFPLTCPSPPNNHHHHHHHHPCPGVAHRGGQRGHPLQRGAQALRRGGAGGRGARDAPRAGAPPPWRSQWCRCQQGRGGPCARPRAPCLLPLPFCARWRGPLTPSPASPRRRPGWPPAAGRCGTVWRCTRWSWWAGRCRAQGRRCCRCCSSWPGRRSSCCTRGYRAPHGWVGGPGAGRLLRWSCRLPSATCRAAQHP